MQMPCGRTTLSNSSSRVGASSERAQAGRSSPQHTTKAIYLIDPAQLLPEGTRTWHHTRGYHRQRADLRQQCQLPGQVNTHARRGDDNHIQRSTRLVLLVIDFQLTGFPEEVGLSFV